MADVFGHVHYFASDNLINLLYTCPIVTDSIDQGTAEDVVTYAQQPVTQTQITSLTVSIINSAVTYSIYLTPTTDRTALDAGAHLFTVCNAVLPVDGVSSTHNFGLVLAPGNTLWVLAATGVNLNFLLNYIEIS
jgi:hypothetical protein